MPSIVLASQSPRRHQLLEAAGIPHFVRAANIDEAVYSNEIPVDYVRRVAREKALAVSCARDEIILSADTTVTSDGHILGKPADPADARRMLELLSGRRHEVITGICLRTSSGLIVEHDVTAVWFTNLGHADIEAYVASGEPMDKAGAYGIQGLGSRYITRIEGSYSNVVGLPVALVWRELERIKNSLS